MLLGIFHSVVVLEVALVFLEQVHKLEVKAYLHNEVNIQYSSKKGRAGTAQCRG